MKATKLPSGNYRATAYLGVDDDGKPIRKYFTASDAKHAIALASDFEDRHKSVRAKGSFDKAIRRFLKTKKAVLSPSTYAEYESRSRMLRASYPAFCAKVVITITSDDLNAIAADMQRVQPPRHRSQLKDKALSPKTIKNYFGFISSVFRNEGLRMPPVDLPRKQVFDIYVPTDNEVKILIDSVKGTDLYIPVLLACFGPIRRGEICALIYPRDFNGNVIHVREAIAVSAHRRQHRKPPKTISSDRFIDMPGYIIDAIKRQGYVTKLTPDMLSERFAYALSKTGLPHFRFHDLRHYCVSTLHAQGVPDAYIMKRGGWSTDNVLKTVYRHTLADREKKYSDQALSHFESVYSE